MPGLIFATSIPYGAARMESSIYFKPSKAFGAGRPEWLVNTVGDHVRFHTDAGMPSLDGIKVALLGVLDDPGHAKPRGCVDAPDAIRAQLYKLYLPANGFGIADLGDGRRGRLPTPARGPGGRDMERARPVIGRGHGG